MKVDPILGRHQMRMMWKSHFFWVRCYLHALWIIWMDDSLAPPCRTQSFLVCSFPTLSPHQQALTWVYVAAAAMGQALFLQPASSTEGARFSIAIGGPPFCRNKEGGVSPEGPLSFAPWKPSLAFQPWPSWFGLPFPSTVQAARLSFHLFLIQMLKANIPPDLKRMSSGWSIASHLLEKFKY